MLFLFIYSCKAQKNNSLENERMNLKKMAFCNCLYKEYPKYDSVLKDGSAAGYFEISNHSIEVPDKINELLTTYFSERKYSSKENLNLGIMKCLDFYESKELEDFIIKMDEEITN